MHVSGLKNKDMLRIESEHDRFYGSIARYYASVFPLNPAQITCVEAEMGDIKGLNFLDVGSGSGELAYGLALKGATVTAIDLNDALMSEAKNNRSHENITYRKANMLHIARLFGRAKFDGVVCFGNTLVHLLNPMQMRDFFSGVLTVLKPGGLFFLQLLNFDYVFQEKIDTLPTVENEHIRFERKYRFVPGSREIRFNTRLTVKATGEVIENETDLLGIGSNDLQQMMDIAGLKEIRMYAGFQKEPFGGNHLPLVVLSGKSHQELNIYGVSYTR
jgi:2-polyprenyl-3-methyl-5-hydroxy-6-metoxy-1,4-benzoquinol methylase